MPTQSHFSNWPVWVRGIVAASSLCVFVAVLSLIGGCGGMSSQQNPGEPDFYIAHVQDQNPVWFKSGANNPAPLTIPSLPAGSSVNDLAALRFTGPSDWLYLVAANANSLVILNKVGSSFQLVATVPVGVNPFGLAIDGTASFAYVSNTGGNSVTVVDLTSNQAVFTIALPNGSQPRGIAVTPDGKKVYVANQGTGTFSVIDAVARTVTGSITVGSQPNRMAMSPNGQELYVSNSGSGTVSVIDVLSDSVSTTIAGVANTRAVAVNGAGADLFVGQAPALSGPGSVALYDTATVSTSTTPIATAANPVFLLGIGPGSFLSADQNAARVTEQWTTTGNPPVNKVWTVGAAPAALAIVREINRSPSTQPQCKLTVTTVGTGTVAVNPSSASGNYTCGATVTLTATPGTGQQFTQWTGDLTGSANPATLKMDTSKNVTATFVAAQNVVTVNTSPAGLAATINGISGTAPVSQGVASGVATPVSVTTPQVVNGSGYTFSNWTGAVANAANASTTVTPAANTTVTANFALACYVLTVNASPPASGTVAASPASGGLAGLPANCYAPGTTVTLTATGANGNVLQSWTGAPGTNAATTVTVNAPTTVTANFGAPANVTLTVATNPTGLLARIGANAAYAAAPISQLVPANQTQTIGVTDPQFVSATGTGYSFSGWSTGGSTAITTVQPSSTFTATANFRAACYALTVTLSPAGSGTVAASPASGGLAGLPANCYAPGTVVTLTATGMAAQNYIFGSWSGAGTGFTTRTVVMNGPSAVTANFSLYPAPNLNFGGANWGYASGSTYQMIGKVGNNGADYNNIKITQVVWTAAAGTGAITDTTALPIAIGNLAGGTGALSSTLTLNAIMPTTVTQFKVCVSGTAVSPLSGNSVAWTDNQNCGHAFPRN